VTESTATPEGDLFAHVMHIDRFGNLILDVTAVDVDEAAILELGGHTIEGLSRTFADAARGQLLAYVGSSRDHVEIALREGNAAREIGINVGDQILIRRAK
jgi:S-adenosylmethionine hydrolase